MTAVEPLLSFLPESKHLLQVEALPLWLCLYLFYLYFSLSLSNHLLQVRPFASKISFELRNEFWVKRRGGLTKNFPDSICGAVASDILLDWCPRPGENIISTSN